MDGIRVDQAARRLHVLQSCDHGDPDGTRIGTYRLHFGDGGTVELPIVYGEDLRDFDRGSDRGKPAPKNATEVFPRSGENSTTRLFLRTYENPRHD